MKRAFTFGLLSIFIMLASPALAYQIDLGGTQPLTVSVVNSTAQQLTIAVDIGALELKPMKNNDGERFWRIVLPDADVQPVIGDPELPVITRMIQLPAAGQAGFRVVSVEYVTIDLNAIEEGYPIWPIQAPISKVPGARENAPFMINPDVYNHRGFNSPTPALGEVGVLRGLRFMPLTLAPIAYDAAANKLRVAKSMTVQVTFEKSAKAVGRLTNAALQEPAFEALAQNLFINYAQMREQTKAPVVPESPVPGGYLIIAAPTYESHEGLLDLAYWKAQKGYNVTLVTTNDTGTSTDDIVAYITDAYNNWTIPPAYLLLVGDTDTIPYFSVLQVSDLYYAAIDGDDYFPDLFYSRFPVRTADQLNNMVDKILNYEFGAWGQADDFLTATFMASNDNYTVSEGTHNYCISTYLDALGFTSNKRYSHQGANINQVIADINGGLNYLIYSGHGSETSWADGPAMSQAQVNGLTNTNYPFVASHACLTNGYHLSYECFGETWVRNPTGGMAFFGSTTYTYWDEDDILQRRYFDGIFDGTLERNYYTLGEFTVYGMAKLWENYSGGGLSQEYWEQYNILGDASVDLWTGQPGDLNVANTPVIFFGSTSYLATVTEGKAPVEGALVGLSLDGQFIASTLTNAGGLATLSWADPITIPGTYKLTVTKHDFLPSQSDVVAASASSDGMLSASPSLVGDDYEISIMVADIDLAGDGTMTVEVASDAETTPEIVTLNEVAPDTGAFSGSITTAAVAGKGDGLIQIQEGDTVVVHYYDADNGSGPEDKYAEIAVDLTPPDFTGLAAATPTDKTVTLTWDAASEPHGPVTYQIYRADVSGGQNWDAPLAQTAALTYVDTDLINNQSYYYVVRATDALGNQDANEQELEGVPIGPNSIFYEDWEAADAVGDWTIDNGGNNLKTWNTNNTCDRDISRMNGTFMICDSDCAGMGATLDERLISPSIDCSNYENVFLRFANYVYWMGEQYSKVYISVNQGAWVLLATYTSDVDEITDIDLSAYADNHSDVRLQFEYYGQYDWYWAIDDIEVLGYEGGTADDDTVDDDTVDDDTVDDDTVDDDTVDDDTVDDDTVDDDTVDDDTVDDDTTDDDTTPVDDDTTPTDDDTTPVDDDTTPADDDDSTLDDDSAADDDTTPPTDDDNDDNKDDNGCGC